MPGAFKGRVLPAFRSAIKLWPWQLTFFEPDKPGPLIYIPGIEGVSIYHLYWSSRQSVQWLVTAALAAELTDKVVRTETACDMLKIISPAHLTAFAASSVPIILSVPCVPTELASAWSLVLHMCQLDIRPRGTKRLHGRVGSRIPPTSAISWDRTSQESAGI